MIFELLNINFIYTIQGQDEENESEKDDNNENTAIEFGQQLVHAGDSVIQQEVSESASDEEDVERSTKQSSSHQDEYMFPTPEEINKACPPAVGMVFDTLQDAVRFVNVYGQLSGFAVIKGRNYKHRKITLICNKSRKTEYAA